ncbi:MAG: hypothetical protein HN487_10625 [Flavobacterium sp.]|nr:hypothetical protein [Flavobacterium sp.]
MQILITIIRFSNNLPPLPGTISKINSNNGSITDESNIKSLVAINNDHIIFKSDGCWIWYVIPYVK